ncbi:MAG: hypothetical protein RIQ56_861 [Candidatus Parcubacteria bacterium]|jgi:cysteine desulfurase
MSVKSASRRRIYLDYASATPILPQAAREVARVSKKLWGNPGSIHAEGVAAKQELLAAREKIAAALAVKAREVVFVSGGTEANNLAILGFARHLILRDSVLKSQGSNLEGNLRTTHWITSVIEHPSVLECFSEIERLGGSVTHLIPNEKGVITPDILQKALRKETVFVSIAWANHEIGVVQPVAKLSQMIRKYEKECASTIVFHSDAGQTPLYKSSYPHTLGVDLFTLDSAKLYGPRGIGAVYLSNQVELAPIVLGGKQERGLRAGTENVALAAGFAEAISIVAKNRHAETERMLALKKEFEQGVAKVAPDAFFNSNELGLPHLINVSFPSTQSEYLTLELDRAGTAVATKSACREGEERISQVVEVLGGPSWRATSTIRFSFGSGTTRADVRRVVAELKRLLRKS